MMSTLAQVAQAAKRGSKELARAFSSSAQVLDVVAAEENVFKRFGNPVPQEVDHSVNLGYIQPTKVTTLSNGLRVATEKIPYATTATVGMWIDAGSRYENDANNGTAHFLEHMAFKGTRSRSSHDLETEIENMGGHLNAYTSREQTVYFAKCMGGDAPKALDILSDILQNSSIDEAAIRRERDVILREMQEVEGMPQEVVFDHLHATAFQHSPLGRTILGSADNVRTITREHLLEYIHTHYTARRMVIAAAGDVNHDALVEQAERAFASLPSGSEDAAHLVASEPSKYTGSDVRFRDPDQASVHFALAFKGAASTDADSIPLMVMQSMIGCWNKHSGGGAHHGSLMAQRVAINGLADSYMAFNTNYHDTGLWGMYAVADRNKVDDLSYCMMQEITKLVYEPVDADVIRGKNALKAQLLGLQSNSQSVADEIGRHMLTYGRRMGKDELMARIDAVDAATVKEVADRFIFDQDPVIAAMGDTQDLPDYNAFRRQTYWLRY